MEIARLADGEAHFLIPGPRPGMRLFLRRLAATSGSAGRAVLYVHGATFPSGLSIAHRFDGRSWRDALCEAGFCVWGLDLYGFGHSDRYPEMDAPAEANPPLCLAEDAAAQLAAAALFILEHQGLSSLSLIAHSWGSMVAGEYDVFESITRPGKMLLLTSWRTAEACAHWTPNTFPAVSELRHRLVRNVRDYGMFERREAAQYYPQAERAA